MTVLRTGIDLIEIARLESIQPRIRERFLTRVYTPAELEEARGSNPSLAGKFAAKEAVAKALACGIGPIHWQDIEIRHGPQGEPQLTLYGAARDLAERLGLTTWSISISHSQTNAVAMAVGLGTDPGQ
jgi:holo-[acyl-carrier protein] synthase